MADTVERRRSAGTAAARISGIWTRFTGGVSLTAVFIAQVLLVYVVVIVSLYNLTRYPDSSDGKLWTALLSSGLGLLLPNPKPARQQNVPNAPQQ